MSARTTLRSATAAEHERVDALFSRFDLRSQNGYRDFLLAQAAAYLPVEQALDSANAAHILPDWPSRRRGALLAADLAALGAAVPQPLAPPELHDASAILGAVYVLEGSRLGGAFLSRGLSADFPSTFLEAPTEKGSWRKLLELLDKLLYGPERIDAAVRSAKEVFMLFEDAAGQFAGTRAE